jgi:hypothetical protein
MTAWYLFDEGLEYDLLGRGELFVMLILTNSSLTVLVMTDEENLVDVHT